MLGEKALELIKELKRSSRGNVPPFNEDTLRLVLEESRALNEQNQADVAASETDEDFRLHPTIQMRHAAIERNSRCLLAYVYNRIQSVKELRWHFGSVLPPEIKVNMSESEVQWFNKYNKSLANYMRSIGDFGGLDLTQHMQPPKTLYIEVRCLVDHGEFETEDGDIILLKKHSQHFLLRTECDQLIRQGVLEHIVHGQY